MGGFELQGLPGMGGGGGFGGFGGAGGVETIVHRLKHAKAAELARSIEKAFPKAKTLKVVAEPTSNLIIIVADSATMKEASKLVKEADSKAAPGGGGEGGPSAGLPSGRTPAGGRPGRPPVGGGGGIPGSMGSGFGGLTGMSSPRAAPVNLIGLKHATAEELAAVVNRVFPTADVTAEPRSNQLIIRADDKTMEEIQKLMTQLDVEVRPKR